ncbi:MAG TPA: glycosyltransferase family 2 protein [Steroidobacteraceae bacterium]|nr:glycosyltransferase family 2 protein [Steroidobacteraceae bacterium]
MTTGTAAGAASAAAAGSSSHLVLIPSYNAGALAVRTVRAARERWNPVWVVVDGSTDGSLQELEQLAHADAGVRVLALPHNRGKGAALRLGAQAARAAGYTHALTMDSDAQHPPQCIESFMALSRAHPEALVLGLPQFDASAPTLRVRGRKICNWWVNLETLWAGIGDSLFGFRVYPLEPLLTVMDRHRWMRRFDFDAESAVRLCWMGIPLINLPAPVRYLRRDEGGVSHFNYVRDNTLLAWMHARLFLAAPAHWPALLIRRRGRGHRL